MASDPEFIRLAQCPPVAWRNGGGGMQLVATHPPGAGTDDFEWRFSVAEVARDSPFSAFAGFDRCIALLSGHGMVLSSPDQDMHHRLDEPLQPFYFSGDIGIHARLIDGPLHNLSVLVKRGFYRITLTPLETQVEFLLSARSAPLLIQCVSGTLRIDMQNQESLRARSGELILWRSESPSMRVSVLEKHAQVIVVQLDSLLV